MRRPRISRRKALVGLAVGVPATLLARPGGHLALSAWRERGELPPVADGYADDASRMSQVKVAGVVRVTEAGAEGQILGAIERARKEKRALSIAGARHTMGGHTSVEDGIILDMAGYRTIALDESRNVLKVGSGARWHDVIEKLHARGKSVWVMQSNSSFSIGGSLSANAHGWQHNRPPIASTVERFRLVKADGRVVECSRTENKELFSLVLGGYGLFGVILDVDLRVVENEMYTAERFDCSADAYPEVFAEKSSYPEVEMVYGRLSVDGDRFLTDAQVTRFSRDRGREIPPLTYPEVPTLKRAIFRGQVGSDYGKRLRWDLERWFGGESGPSVSRNQILLEPVGMFVNQRPERTDVLHEYFVPPRAFAAFLAKARAAFAKHRHDLINVTIRNVDTDPDAFLRYATEPMFSLVMLFAMERTSDADDAMKALTRDLIDAALAVGGRYYLPYRLHASREQLEKAYPQARDFFAKKAEYDPDRVFRNRFFDTYA